MILNTHFPIQGAIQQLVAPTIFVVLFSEVILVHTSKGRIRSDIHHIGITASNTTGAITIGRNQVGIGRREKPNMTPIEVAEESIKDARIVTSLL